MSFLKFGEDGKLLLTGKLKEEKDEEDNSVVLTKKQISDNNPAIAQLVIKLGKKISGNEAIINSLRNQCEKYVQYKQSSSQTRIEVKDGEIVVESRGSWDMYLYLKELMMNIKNNNEGLRIVVRGSWAKD